MYVVAYVTTYQSMYSETKQQKTPNLRKIVVAGFILGVGEYNIPLRFEL